MRDLKCNLGFKNPNTADNPIFDNRKYRDAQCNLPLFYQQAHTKHPHTDPTRERERESAVAHDARRRPETNRDQIGD